MGSYSEQQVAPPIQLARPPVVNDLTHDIELVARIEAGVSHQTRSAVLEAQSPTRKLHKDGRCV